jgi:hypothetical protein
MNLLFLNFQKTRVIPDNFLFAQRKKIDPESDLVFCQKKPNRIPHKLSFALRAKRKFCGMTLLLKFETWRAA